MDRGALVCTKSEVTPWAERQKARPEERINSSALLPAARQESFGSANAASSSSSLSAETSLLFSPPAPPSFPSSAAASASSAARSRYSDRRSLALSEVVAAADKSLADGSDHDTGDGNSGGAELRLLLLLVVPPPPPPLLLLRRDDCNAKDDDEGNDAAAEDPPLRLPLGGRGWMSRCCVTVAVVCTAVPDAGGRGTAAAEPFKKDILRHTLRGRRMWRGGIRKMDVRKERVHMAMMLVMTLCY